MASRRGPQAQESRLARAKANAAIRKILWERQPYNENLPALEDLAWAKWAFEKGYRIAYVPEAEIIHIHQESSRGIFNRYKREGMAFNQIYPYINVKLTTSDWSRYWETLKTEAGNRLSRLYKSTNAVTQNKTVTIGDLTYAARLFRGASNDPTNSYADVDRDAIGPDNEWNAIILPLHEHAKLQNWNYSAYAGVTEDWGVYLTDKDLVTHYNHGSGSYTWCQDVRDTTSWGRVIRGGRGASYLYSSYSWYVYSDTGFRPVLELPQTATL